MISKNNKYEGLFIIHLSDMDNPDQLKSIDKVNDYVKSFDSNLIIHRHFIKDHLTIDASTSQIIDNYKRALLLGIDTPILLIDETLAGSFDWVGRLRYGAVVLINGQYIDKSSLINFSSKYIDLMYHSTKSNDMRGYETIQIIRNDLFVFDFETALNETKAFYRFAPCKLIPVDLQLSLRGNLDKLIKVLNDYDCKLNYKIFKHKTKKSFDIDSDLLYELSKFDTSANSLNSAKALLKRNEKLKDKSKIINQF